MKPLLFAFALGIGFGFSIAVMLGRWLNRDPVVEDEIELFEEPK
jgi:hypothetical protein